MNHFGYVMVLGELFEALSDIFSGNRSIERQARAALLRNGGRGEYDGVSYRLPQPIMDVMRAEDADPICDLILETALPWAPPETGKSRLYKAHSTFKSHVELIGPNGLVPADDVRVGLYGFLPECDYGVRTHPAEEIFVMLAGIGFWRSGDSTFKEHRPGARAYHPSMIPHATRSGRSAFMSAYAWCGDISTANYQYLGLPESDLSGD